MKTYITKSEKETLALAKKLAQTLKGGEVIALTGELGAGKTVFAKGLAAGLGVKKIVASPTFTLMNVYAVKRRGIARLVHIDCYRLKNASEFTAIGVSEYLNDPSAITVIEWAEKAKTLLPKKRIDIKFDVRDTNSRIISVNIHTL